MLHSLYILSLSCWYLCFPPLFSIAPFPDRRSNDGQLIITLPEETQEKDSFLDLFTGQAIGLKPVTITGLLVQCLSLFYKKKLVTRSEYVQTVDNMIKKVGKKMYLIWRKGVAGVWVLGGENGFFYFMTMYDFQSKRDQQKSFR